MVETDAMFEKRSGMDKIFKFNQSSDDLYLLPCFAVKQGNECTMLWVDSIARKLGLGKKLVKSLKIKSINKPLPGSEGFWKKMGL